MTDIYFEDIKARPDVVPSKWHAPKLDKHGVQYITGKINRGSQLSTKSRLNSSYWKKAPLD